MTQNKGRGKEGKREVEIAKRDKNKGPGRKTCCNTKWFGGGGFFV
jgi:hypothetical protein